MLKLSFLILILSCGLCSSVAAQPVTLAEVQGALEQPFRNAEAGIEGIKDFQAEFFQESHIASIDRSQQAQGSVQFKFPQGDAASRGLALFRWDYRQPSPQEIISDGQTMWFYLPENRQVIKSDMKQLEQQQGQNPVTFLGNLGNLSRDFQISWAQPDRDEQDNPILLLQPLSPSQYLDRLEVVVAKRAVAEFRKLKRAGKTFPLRAISVFDPGGNRTTILFRKVKRNLDPPLELFHFQPPAGVEVVTPAEQGVGS